MENVSIETVLNEIESKTDYRFLYNGKTVDLSRTVNVFVENKELNDVLSYLFDGSGIKWVVSDRQVVLKNAADSSASQQDKKITGTVFDTAGMPVIGANVIEKGTTNGTITDIDGRFALTVPEGAVLQITYIGYAPKELSVKGKQSFDIHLSEDTQALDEVVVVGFGTQKKVNLTGAVGVTTADELKDRPVTNTLQALQGLIPGLNIAQNTGELGATPSFNIRGTGTIGSGSNGAPLVLIDGAEGDIQSINPQDIENISVLKDASASSIYGSRAPFGVILVTTKQGKAGQTRVNYNNNFRWFSPTVMPEWMDSYSFATYINDANQNSHQSHYFTPEWLQRIKDFQNGILKQSDIEDPDNPGFWGGIYNYGCDNIDK